MKIGYTGTREGMIEIQFRTFGEVYASMVPWTEFRHGCCPGADEQAVVLVYDMQTEAEVPCVIHAHPSTLVGMLSKKAELLSGIIHPKKPPLIRNHDIVNEVDEMIACPKGPEELWSGTWACVRYARKQRKPITIIWPNGNVTEERP